MLALEEGKHFARHKSDLATAAAVLRKAAFASEVAVAFEALSRHRAHFAYRFQTSLGLAADLNGNQTTGRQPLTSPKPRSCRRRPGSARARARASCRADR